MTMAAGQSSKVKSHILAVLIWCQKQPKAEPAITYLSPPQPWKESNARLRPTVCSSAPSQGQFPGLGPLTGGQLTKRDLAFQQPQARPRGYPPRLLRGKASPKETMPPDLEQGWGSRERQIC